jgi:hypothetical protein
MPFQMDNLDENANAIPSNLTQGWLLTLMQGLPYPQ